MNTFQSINTRLETKNTFNRDEFLSKRNIEDINLLNSTNQSNFLDFAVNSNTVDSISSDSVASSPVSKQSSNLIINQKNISSSMSNDKASNINTSNTDNNNFTIQQSKFNKLINQKELELNQLEKQQQTYFENEKKKYSLRYNKLQSLEKVVIQKYNQLLQKEKQLQKYEKHLKMEHQKLELEKTKNSQFILKKKELLEKEETLQIEREKQLKLQDRNLKKLEELEKNIEQKTEIMKQSSILTNDNLTKIEEDIQHKNTSINIDLPELHIKIDRTKLINILLVKLTEINKYISYDLIEQVLNKYNIQYEQDMCRLNKVIDELKISKSSIQNISDKNKPIKSLTDSVTDLDSPITDSPITDLHIDTHVITNSQDIEKNFATSTKQEKIQKLEISSEDRNKTTFPNIHHFSIDLDKEFFSYQISKLKIISTLIPLSEVQVIKLEIPECRAKLDMTFDKIIDNQFKDITIPYEIQIVPYMTLDKLTFILKDSSDEPYSFSSNTEIYFTIEISYYES